ncbi:MAG: 4Fe-4S dicluster domain-containing protein [Desulfobacterales bacterium]|nr:4Fe-4S dicluster domain-containing protein [Desulfobacterales bacterium]
MTTTATIPVNPQGLTSSLQAFFRSVLALSDIRALLVPLRLPVNHAVMPTLVTDAAAMAHAAPLSPVFPLNAARMAARLTRKPMGGKIAAFLRPCEIRAFVELVKLKQARTEELVLIGIDCPGAFSNRESAHIVQHQVLESDDAFCSTLLSGTSLPEGLDLSPACRACEHPVPAQADLAISLLGVETQNGLPVTAQSEAGEAVLCAIGLPAAPLPASRAAAVEAFIARRIDFRDRMFADTAAAVNTVEKLERYFAACVNCYNCRVACPVCYCKECVFVTGAFDHEPFQYLKWSERKGAIKMPTDTLFYHITRLAHMSTACVGCGQCSNACPNDIAVMELFRLVAHDTQRAFDYSAGKSVDDPPPLSGFREDEFQEVVGMEPVR